MYQERLLDTHVSEGTGSDSSADIETITKRYPVENGRARFYLDVTLGGASMTLNIDIIGVIGGKRHILDSFTEQSVAALEMITVEECPNEISFDWTVGGTTPLFDWTVQMTRS